MSLLGSITSGVFFPVVAFLIALCAPGVEEYYLSVNSALPLLEAPWVLLVVSLFSAFLAFLIHRLARASVPLAPEPHFRSVVPERYPGSLHDVMPLFRPWRCLAPGEDGMGCTFWTEYRCEGCRGSFCAWHLMFDRRFPLCQQCSASTPTWTGMLSTLAFLFPRGTPQ